MLPLRILLVTPYDRDRAALGILLTAEGHVVEAARVPADGPVLAETFIPDVVIADAQVPGLDGEALVRAFSRLPHQPRIILLCPRARRCPPRHEVWCLIKPIDFDRLLEILAAPRRAHRRVA